MKSKTANVHFNATGTPVADDYDDVYFSNDSGIDETRHVFMAGNGLPERWLTCEQHSFVIAETGFGTGLNFLVALRAFKDFRLAHPNHPLKQLYFISTERFPLSRDDMSQALEAFPALDDEASALSQCYPLPMEGCHRLEFHSSGVTLDLWMGDVHALLPAWSVPEQGLVDAWFLDGFAPSKNPDMWTNDLFSQMARLTKPGGSFATFTAAGIVKRGLAANGFEVSKCRGFGRKRDMLTGHFQGPAGTRQLQPPYYRYASAALSPGEHVLIVGAGLAGATTALMLCDKGVRVTLCDQQPGPAGGASGNPQGGFYPQLHSEASNPSQIQAHSFLYARRYYDRIVASQRVAHDFCGVLQLSFNTASAARHKKLHETGVWPTELVSLIDQETTSALAGIPLPYAALALPMGGWLSPPDLTAAMLNIAQQSGLLTQQFGLSLSAIEENCEYATAYFEDQTQINADHIVLATGHEALQLDVFKPLPLRAVRGQVEAVPTSRTLSSLRQVICHKGYLTPQFNGRHALGSTYVKQDTATDIRWVESQTNLATHNQALAKCDWIQSLHHDGEARAAVRLGAPDHQPVCGAIGQLKDQRTRYADLQKGKPLSVMSLPPASRISALTALGSRGLTTAPLMAQVLVSGLMALPMPAPAALLNAVNPNRFIIRDCIRGKMDDEDTLPTP